MDEDLFSRLFELFNQPGPVNWPLAAEAAKSIAGKAEPIDPWLAEEYQELTRLAQIKIAEAAPLPTPTGDGHPVDRRTWALENLRSFRYLVEPLAAKLQSGAFDIGGGPLDALLKPMTPALLGLQMGVVVGFLSHRVLGQFDVRLPTADAGKLYFVVPNVEAFATSNDLEPRQVRLWVALHEVTHEAEFSRDWVRPKFIELVERFVERIEFDVSSLTTSLEGLQDPQALEEMMNEVGGLAGLVVSEEQRPLLEAIQAFMTVIEGYSDYLMDTVAAGLLPDLDRMRVAIELRHSEPDEGSEILNRLLGLELKHDQYRLGGSFCREVVERWGPQALNRIWDEPENLPTLTELGDPVAWAARVLLDELF
jgi:putative hydrolase